VSSIDERKKDELDRAAVKYSARGYEVLTDPKGPRVPEFLRGFTPDLVALGHNESVVVEVKTDSTIRDHRLTALARTIDSRPEWRLELIMMSETPIDADGPDDVATKTTVRSPAKLSSAALRRRRLVARQLVKDEHFPEALLLFWSVVEGALRLIARRRDIEFEKETPRGIAKQMTVLGYVSQKDFRLLEEVARARNALVHGREPVGVNEAVASRIDALSGELLARVTTTHKKALLKSQDIYRAPRRN
jgi:hypothetical protein